MGGQDAKRTIDGDVDADSGEAGFLGRGRELALRASSLAVGGGTSQAYA